MPNDFSSLLGFGQQDQPQPNRAQRRALAKKLGAQKRRGQRAYNRAVRNGGAQ